MTKWSRFEIVKGYRPGAPKKPLWQWRCACGKCSANWAGPFKTLREAKADISRWVDDLAASGESTHH